MRCKLRLDTHIAKSWMYQIVKKLVIVKTPQ